MALKTALKAFMKKNPGITALGLRLLNVLNFSNRIHVGQGNRLVYRTALLRDVHVEIHGTGNRIIIDDMVRLLHCRICIYGNNNTLYIGPRSCLDGGYFWMENDDNKIEVGAHTFFHGDAHIAALESTSVVIGEDCLFASDVHFRTGDSHSIINKDGVRINHAADIRIGDHCWIGTKVICLKGTEIGNHCVVGAGSLVNGKYAEANCIIAGIPAKVVRKEIDWIPECV